MVDKDKPRDASKEVAALPVAPKQTGKDGRNTEAEDEKECDIPSVLPPHDLVSAQIADIGYSGLPAGFEKHPTDVGIPETLMGVVWVQVGVGITMVGTVAPGPPLD